jgi:hypothetical protein
MKPMYNSYIIIWLNIHLKSYKFMSSLSFDARASVFSPDNDSNPGLIHFY